MTSDAAAAERSSPGSGGEIEIGGTLVLAASGDSIDGPMRLTSST